MGAPAVAADLPPGFTLDAAPAAAGSSTLPAGFTLDAPKPMTTGETFLSEVNAAARGATFGLADKAAAAAEATLPLNHWITGQPVPAGDWSQRYQSQLQQYKDMANAAAAQHPYLMGAAYGTGALGTAGLLPGLSAATMTGRMGQAAAQGAGMGGLSGYAASSDSSLGQTAKDIGLGAATGAVLGAASVPIAEKIIAPIASFIGEKFGFGDALRQKAMQQIITQVGEDAKVGGPTAQDMLDLTNKASELGKPITLADVGGEGTQGLAERLANQPGQSRTIAASVLNARDKAAGMRLAGDVSSYVAAEMPADITAFDMGKALQQAKQTASAPLYEAAYSAPPLNPDFIEAGGRLDNLMARPSMQKAANNALAIAREEGRNPASLGITFDAAGDPKFEAVPSWQTLDYLKRGLDDVLNASRDKVTGRLVLDEQGRATLGTLNSFRSMLTDENPIYAKALEAWSGPSGAENAIKMGQSVLSRSPGQIASDLEGLSAADKEFYKLGVADSLKTMIAKTGAAGDEARKLVGTDYVKQQLRPLFDTDAAFNRFVDAATLESKMFQTRYQMLGNSPSARRLAQMAAANKGEGFLQPTVEAAAAFGTGEPILAAKAALGAGQRIMGILNRPSPAVDAATAGLLFNTSPEANLATIHGLLNMAAPSGAPYLRAPVTGLLSQIPAKYLLGPTPQ